MGKSQHEAYNCYKYRAEASGRPVLPRHVWYKEKENGTYNEKYLKKVPFQLIYKQGIRALKSKHKEILSDLQRNNTERNRERLVRIEEALKIWGEENGR
jgi:hypothetical protein